MKKPAYLFALFIVAAFISCKKDSTSAPTSASSSGNEFTGGDIYTVAGNGKTGYTADGITATETPLNGPALLTIDASGNIYFADQSNNRIRKITSNGIISTIAGNGTVGYAGDGGAASGAELNEPSGVALDMAGNLYIADQLNNRIRKVTASGIISTIAGNGTQGYSGDGGPATSAGIYGPVAVAANDSGNIYIADCNNFCIRKINTAGVISTIAGGGNQPLNDSGVATNVSLPNPIELALDKSGNIYVAVISGRIYKINMSNSITIIAGSGIAGFSGDGGSAISAQLDNPNGIAIDDSNNIYIADYSNNRIRKINTRGIISTYAGNGLQGYSGDGGSATSAELNGPIGVALDGSGNVYFTDYGNQRIRKVYK